MVDMAREVSYGRGMETNGKAVAKKTANGNGGGKWITPVRRLAIFLRDHGICIYCMKNLHGAAPFDVTLDHIKCGHFAGNHHESNLILSCRSCNSSRRDLPLARFCGPETRAHIRRNVRRSLRPYLKLAKAIMAGEIGDPRS